MSRASVSVMFPGRSGACCRGPSGWPRPPGSGWPGAGWGRRRLRPGRHRHRDGVAGGAVEREERVAVLEVGLGGVDDRHLGPLPRGQRLHPGGDLEGLEPVEPGWFAGGLGAEVGQRHTARRHPEVHGAGPETLEVGGPVRPEGVGPVAARAVGGEQGLARCDERVGELDVVDAGCGWTGESPGPRRRTPTAPAAGRRRAGPNRAGRRAPVGWPRPGPWGRGRRLGRPRREGDQPKTATAPTRAAGAANRDVRERADGVVGHHLRRNRQA